MRTNATRVRCELDILPLAELTLADAAVVGDEAACLHLLEQCGYPIVPTLAIALPFPTFPQLDDRTLHIDTDDWQTLQTISHQLRQGVLESEVPDEFLNALATAIAPWQCDRVRFHLSPVGTPPRWCDLWDTITVDRDRLALGFQQARSQLFRARSLLFAQRTGIDWAATKVGMLVQPDRDVRIQGILEATATHFQIAVSSPTDGYAANLRYRPID